MDVVFRSVTATKRDLTLLTVTVLLQTYGAEPVLLLPQSRWFPQPICGILPQGAAAPLSAAGSMDRVLIQVKKKKDRRRLEDWLSKTYQTLLAEGEPRWDEPFDLAVIDGPSLRQFRRIIRARRKAEEPAFLPFLLLTVRRRSSMPGRHLGRAVDDLIIRPLNERETQARVANLLRMRHWSLDLKKEHDRVMKLAVTDDVSGFHNTRYLHRYLDRLIETAAAKPVEISLVFFDLDNFKRLVDAYGH